MQDREIRTFFGMNGDDNPADLPNGDYVYAENIQIFDTTRGVAGAVQNMYGAREVPYALPSGTNKCVGVYHDKGDSSVFYFIWNSNGSHRILRYMSLTDTIRTVVYGPALNFSENTLISGVSMVDQKFLYFTDGVNPQRKINVIKADDTTKKPEIHFFIDESVAIGQDFRIIVSFPAPSVSVTSTYTVTSTDYRNIIKDLADKLAIDMAGFATVEFSGTFVKLTSLTEGYSVVDVSEFTGVSYVPTVQLGYRRHNQYDYDPLIGIEDERIINLAKNPPQCEPIPQYSTTGSDRDINYLKDKLFQFRYQLVYDDNEKSAWSPISYVALPDSVPIEFPNIIDVFLPEIGVETVVGINVAFRESNIDDFKLAVSLDRYQFVVWDPVDPYPKYRFKNDGAYTYIDPIESDKLFDAIPVKSNTLTTFKGRLFLGGNTEGFDQIPIDAKIDVSFNDSCASDPGTLTTISGRVKVRNPIYQLSPIPYVAGPLANNGIVWGFSPGTYGDPSGSNGAITTTSYVFAYGSTPLTSAGLTAVWGTPTNWTYDVLKRTCQYMPLGGFVVYLAGLPYFAVTEQRVVINGVVRPDWDVRFKNFNAYAGDIYNLFANSKDLDGSTVDMLTQFDVYHEFTICNVPTGDYIVRVADHKVENTSTNDYQLTSTRTYGTSVVYGGAVTYNEFEIKVSAPLPGVVYDAGVFHVDDLQWAYFDSATSGDWDAFTTNTVTIAKGIEGYIEDTAGDRIERWGITPFDGTSSYAGVITDHNGYSYAWERFDGMSYADWQNLSVIDEAEVFADPGISGGTIAFTTQDGYDGTPLLLTIIGNSILTPYNNSTPGKTSMSPFEVTALSGATIGDYYTYADGGVIDATTGAPLSGITVTADRGRTVTSDSSGAYSIKLYKPFGYTSRDVELYFGSFNYPLTTFSPSQVVSIGTISYPAPYNSINHYLVTPVMEATRGMFPVISNKYLKRGGEYDFGIVYYDDLNRSTTVLTNQFLKTKIPFWTEEVGGVITDGTPILTWEIYHTPPVWATHYQWVRTRNLKFRKYLQFITDKSSIGKSFELYAGGGFPPPVFTTITAAATEIWVNINSIDRYREQHSGSSLVYDFAKGDRIRFILDGSFSLFDQYIDVEIKGFDEGFVRIEYDPDVWDAVKDGTALFEIYSPLPSEEGYIFYEISECYDILDPGTSDRRHAGGYLGSAQTVGSPATGQFYTGDTYYRDRDMVRTDGFKYVGKVEDSSYSDFYASQIEDIGRVNAVNKLSKQEYRRANVCWSQEYIPETFINGLSTFEPNSNRTLSQSSLDISRIEVVGTIILAWQTTKVATLFINENVFTDKDGSDVVAVSTEVLGSYRYLTGDYGTTHAMSVITTTSYAYWFDEIAGAVCRYAMDGVTPISQYKMDKFFKNLANDMTDGQDKRVTSWYDYHTNEVFFLIKYNRIEQEIGRDGLPFETIVPVEYCVSFNEKTNRWTSFYTFFPDFGCAIRNRISTIKDGVFYVHDSESRNNFYGSVDPSVISVPINKGAKQIRKTLLQHGVTSNTIWRNELTTTPNGQATSNIEADYEKYENTYYAPYMMDINTPGVAIPAIEGDPLTDYYAVMNLRCDSESFSILEAVNVGFMVSSVIGN